MILDIPKIGDGESPGVLWDIHGRIVDAGPNGYLIQLHWGWTQPGQDLSNYAEDAPRGYDSVIITFDQAHDLMVVLADLLVKRAYLPGHPLYEETLRQIEELNSKIDLSELRNLTPKKETDIASG